MTRMSPAIAVALGLVMLVVGPVAGESAFLALDHLSVWSFPQPIWIAAWAASIAVGIWGVWLLPIKRLYRGLISVPYAGVMAYVTFIWLFVFECSAFGACL